MNRMMAGLIGGALVALSAAAQEAAPSKSEAETLYLKARSEQKSGDTHQAIQTAAQVVALYSSDKEWMPKCELLCAELYLEQGLLKCGLEGLVPKQMAR